MSLVASFSSVVAVVKVNGTVQLSNTSIYPDPLQRLPFTIARKRSLVGVVLCDGL